MASALALLDSQRKWTIPKPRPFYNVIAPQLASWALQCMSINRSVSKCRNSPGCLIAVAIVMLGKMRVPRSYWAYGLPVACR